MHHSTDTRASLLLTGNTSSSLWAFTLLTTLGETGSFSIQNSGQRCLPGRRAPRLPCLLSWMLLMSLSLSEAVCWSAWGPSLPTRQQHSLSVVFSSILCPSDSFESYLKTLSKFNGHDRQSPFSLCFCTEGKRSFFSPFSSPEGSVLWISVNPDGTFGLGSFWFVLLTLGSYWWVTRSLAGWNRSAFKGPPASWVTQLAWPSHVLPIIHQLS